MMLSALALALVTAPLTTTEPEVWLLAVGANDGLLDEEPLRFAVDDAQRYARTLAKVGGLTPEHTQVLIQPKPDDVRAARRQIADKTSRLSTPPIVHFYYSGHGDRDTLHLGPKRRSIE